MKYQSITPNRRCHRAQQPVILVGVIHPRRQDHVSVRYRRGEVMKDVLDFVPVRWKATVGKGMETRLGIRKECPGR